MLFTLIALPLGCSRSADSPGAPSQPALIATAISPTAGPISGGTAVTLTGSGFREGATVTFGGTPAADVRVISSWWLNVVAPAHAAGGVDVVVANPDGRSIRLTSRYSYVPDDPDDCGGCWDY
jgi:IPT/TIG domain-containing protein